MYLTTKSAITPKQILSTRQEAAAFFGVSTRSLDSWVKAGQITPTRLGKLVRFHSDELLRIASEGITVTRDPQRGDV